MNRGEFGDYYSRLARIAGVGETATTQLNSLGANFADNSAYVRGKSADYYGNSLPFTGAVNAAGTIDTGNNLL